MFKKLNKALAKPVIRFIKLYQYTLSPDKGLPSFWLKGRICAHEPHCSKYSIQALKRYGFWPGIFYATDRVLHCTASMHKHYDPDHYRVVFFSSAPIGVPFLKHLAEDKRFEVVGVVTQCDKPSGRGLEMCENIIKEEANKLFPPSTRNKISKIILIHGKDATPSDKRYPRFTEQMKKKNIPIYIPTMPHTNEPILKERLTEIDKLQPDENTILIGHSRGGVAILRRLEQYGEKKKVKKVVLIATNDGHSKYMINTEKNNGFYSDDGYDFTKIKSTCNNFVIFHSKDDQLVDYQAGIENTKGLDAKLHTFENKKHFGNILKDIGFPELIPEIFTNSYEPTSAVLLLDGFGGDGTSNRFPRLKNELEKKGILVYNPCPKNTDEPILQEQLDDIIEKYGDKINENTIIIGHSLGCLLANHLITKTGKKIAKLISVAPAFRENSIDNIVQRFPEFEGAKKYLQDYQKKDFNSKKLNSLIKNHIVYLSDNDPYIPHDKAKQYYQNYFDNVIIKTFPGKGHFNENANIMQLPEILSDVLENSSEFVSTPTKLNPEKSEEGRQFAKRLTEKKPDLLVVIAYGKIIPQAILDIPKIAPINIHGSLLPKYRGASPIQSTLLNNDKETGITIMKMDATMDTGNMIDILRFTIPFSRTTKDLIDEMKKIGPKFLNDTLWKYGKKLLGEVQQNEDKATYCEKIEKEFGLIDPRKDSIETIYNKYRAFALRPKIYFMLAGKRIIVEELKLSEPLYNSNDEVPLFKKDSPLIKGDVRETDREICLHPAVIEISLKPEGKKAMPRKEFLNGYMK